MDSNRRALRYTAAVAWLAVTAAIATGAAHGDIVYTLATKVCAGPQGGGINLRLGLNHLWPASKKARYRARIYDPQGRRVYPYGTRTTWDAANYFYATDIPGALDYVLPRNAAGRYSVEIETYLANDYRYADATAGRWDRWRLIYVRVYSCTR